MSYIKLKKKTKILNREFPAGTVVQVGTNSSIKGLPCDKDGNELEKVKIKKEEGE